jgi:antitoxin ParD1/3/4
MEMWFINSAVTAMSRLDLLLPDSLRYFVDEQVASGGYATPSDYIAAVLKEKQASEAVQQLEQALLDGLDSGPAVPMSADDWEGIRSEVRKRIAERNG